MTELKIEYIPIDQLKPYEKNAKLHPPDQVEHIANSIRDGQKLTYDEVFN